MAATRTRRSSTRRGLLRGAATFGWLTAASLLLGTPHHDLILAAVTGLGAAALIAAWVVKTWRKGQTIRAELAARRHAARAKLDTPEKLHACAPLAAMTLAGFSLFAVLLSLTATGPPGSPGGVSLPPVTDARVQLWAVVLALPAAELVTDCWLGTGTLARMLRSDGWTLLAIMFTAGLSALPALLILRHVASHAAWFALIAGQFAWVIGGMLGAGLVSGARQARVFPPPAAPESAAWLAENAARTDCEVVLESAGTKLILIAGGIRRLAGVDWKQAMDLTEAAPAVVLRDVPAAEAVRARNLLVSRGATVLLR